MATAGIAASEIHVFSVGARVQAEAYYCTGDDVNQTCTTNPNDLLPTVPDVSDTVVVVANGENPGNICAVMGGGYP